MTGLSDTEQKKWRKDIIHGLKLFINPSDISIFDPTDYDYTDIEGTLEQERFAMKNDIRNLYEADLIICNISTNPFSIGTNMELGMGYQLGIPIIFYNPAEVELHPWQQLMSDAVLYDIEDLVEFVKEFYIRK